MGAVIPFFHYDIFARIVPGALTLGALAVAGIELPPQWAALLAVKASWAAVVVPLVVAGASYVIGVLYEVAFELPIVRRLPECLRRMAFASACEIKQVRYLTACKSNSLHKWIKRHNPNLGESEVKKKAKDEMTKRRRDLRMRRHDLWNRQVYGATGERARLFAHALRFHAEARMCLHSFFPVCFLVWLTFSDAYGVWCRPQKWYCGIASAIAVLLAAGAYVRGRRRWVECLSANRVKCLT